MNNNNKLIISAAGSGKTTHIVNEALNLNKTKRILITTYTIENETEKRNKILQKRKCIPSNITIQGWFSFLLQHGVRPFQGSMNDMLFDTDIKGMLLCEGKSAPKYDEFGRPLFLKGGRPQYYGEIDFRKFYFSHNWKIYSDKVSKFIVGCNEKTNGAIIDRLSCIYSNIFIDEVQDLAGFDLDIIKLLFQSDIETILVGDPRQVTYKTNHYRKYPQYKDGKIKEFVENELGKNTNCYVDEQMLKKSHRNNKQICDYSSKLYPEFEKSEPCECDSCRTYVTPHEGVFIVRSADVNEYLRTYNPTQLIWDKRTQVNQSYPILNFGSAKGKTMKRVIIYPTEPICAWMNNNNVHLKPGTKSKFYVALTRAIHSVAIVFDYNDNANIEGVRKWR